MSALERTNSSEVLEILLLATTRPVQISYLAAVLEAEYQRGRVAGIRDAQDSVRRAFETKHDTMAGADFTNSEQGAS